MVRESLDALSVEELQKMVEVRQREIAAISHVLETRQAIARLEPAEQAALDTAAKAAKG